MKEFSVQQYDVVIPRYLPFVQYTGTPGYSDVVSGNNWGMELNMNIQQNGNKYNLIYPKIIKYYEGMINYIGDIYNIDCDTNCMTKNTQLKKTHIIKINMKNKKLVKIVVFQILKWI